MKAELKQVAWIGLAELLSHKFRSFLTVLGVTVLGTVLSSAISVLPALHAYNVLGALVLLFYWLIEKGMTVPGEVFLDDIRVVDVASGRQVSGLSDFEGGMESFSRNWTWWPPGPANTVATVGVETNTGAGGSAGLRVSLRAPGSGGWCKR